MGIKSSREEGDALPPSQINNITREVKSIWERGLNQLPVDKDIPRLTRKMGVFSNDIKDNNNNNNNNLNNNNSNNNKDHNFFFIDDDDKAANSCRKEYQYTLDKQELTQAELKHEVFQLLSTLCRVVEKQSFVDESTFNKQVDLEDHETLRRFLCSTFGEDSRTVRLLKSCNQSIVAPAVTKLKQLLLRKIRFKDVQGGWRIMLFVGGEMMPPVVVHRRTEQVIIREGDRLENSYRFEWELRIEFDSGLVNYINQVQLRLVGVDFSASDVKHSEKDRTRSEKMLRQTLLSALKGGGSGGTGG